MATAVQAFSATLFVTTGYLVSPAFLSLLVTIHKKEFQFNTHLPIPTPGETLKLGLVEEGIQYVASEDVH